MRVRSYLPLDEVAGVVQVDTVSRLLMRFNQHVHFLSVVGAAKLTQLVSRILLGCYPHILGAAEVANRPVHAICLNLAGRTEASRRRLPASLSSKALSCRVEQ